MENSEPFDVFLWANQVDAIKNNVSAELFLFNRNYTPYKIRYSDKLTGAVKSVFMQEAVSFIINEAEKGLECRDYERADGEEHVIYRASLSKVGKAETLIHLIENEYKDKFADADITFFYTLIDDAVARVIRSDGGYIWACKNYDGDVMSDMVATAFGSLAMMTSVLVSPDGIYEYEAAHGTVQRHYYKHLKGETTSTNSVATLFAWTGALRKRGELDNIPELCNFADKLEKATLATIEDGIMTGDLALLSSLENKTKVDTETFLVEVNKRLSAML